ncbi:hypothetical protein Tco_0894197 [Tanacetum coccineum]|uniref:Uncharacterized protein n=1 Tax=Tanacetum coccineum TaxID=301880 RepID=A0ABQ5CBG2_9ASTR
MLPVCKTAVSNVPKAPKPSSNAKRVPQGIKPGPKPGHKKHSTSSTHPSVSSSEATKVVAKMYKEDQQATGDPNSLRVTSEEGVHPQPSSVMSTFTNIKPVFSASYIFHSESASGNDASVDFTAEVDPKISAPNDFVPHQQDPDKGSKNYALDHTFALTNPSVLIDKTKSARDGSQIAHIVSGTKVDTRSAFMDDEDHEDEPFIAPKKSSNEHAARNKDTHAEPKSTSLEQDKAKAAAEIATLKAQFVFPNINQLIEHLVSSMKPKFSKLLSSHDFRSSIPTKLKELLIKITALFREVNELKKHIQEFEIELPEVFNEIPQKLETFSFTVSNLTTQTLEALPSLLNKVTNTLNRFASILNAHNKGVPSASKSTASPVEGEKNTNPVIEDVELANLIDLMGIDVVEEYHKKKLLYNKYYEKMLKRNKSPKITNCEVLTKKGPITLKIYREDGSEEVISNLKVSNLHLDEWREVTQPCPDKSKRGWKPIYGLVNTRLDQLTQTEQELKIDLNKPIKEQDPLNELNELVNKKRKKASDFSD